MAAKRYKVLHAVYIGERIEVGSFVDLDETVAAPYSAATLQEVDAEGNPVVAPVVLTDEEKAKAEKVAEIQKVVDESTTAATEARAKATELSSALSDTSTDEDRKASADADTLATELESDLAVVQGELEAAQA